jgi:hypothetical protein
VFLPLLGCVLYVHTFTPYITYTHTFAYVDIYIFIRRHTIAYVDVYIPIHTNTKVEAGALRDTTGTSLGCKVLKYIAVSSREMLLKRAGPWLIRMIRL